MYFALFIISLCLGTIAAQFGPMGGPEAGFGNEMGRGGGGFNPFAGPPPPNFDQPQQRGMNMNNNRVNNDNRDLRDSRLNGTDGSNDKRNQKKPVEQGRSGTDQMLTNMGLDGIQSFYQALTNELARNPNGFQGGNAGGGAPQNQGFRK